MSEGLENFSTVVTSGAAVAAVYFAWMGLSTWKTQLKWQTDHELARRLLVEVYRFRDAVSSARNPFVWAHEMREDNEKSTSRFPTEDERHLGLMRAYQRRFNEIGAVGPQLYALLLESEAVWGPELSGRWKKVNRLQNELSSQTQLYLDYTDPRNKGADPSAFYADKDAIKAAHLIVHSVGEAEGTNDFSKRFAAAIAEVEDYLRPKLGRRPQ